MNIPSSTDGNNVRLRRNSAPVADCNSRSDASRAACNNYARGSASGTWFISNANIAAVAQAGKRPKVNSPY